MVEYEYREDYMKEYALCHLNSKSKLNEHLNLNFKSGERISFFSIGDKAIHLSGYFLIS